MRFTGIVRRGFGEGAGYVERYNDAFAQRLGTRFFPGTLNIETKEIIKLKDPITVDPKLPGLLEVHCYPVRIGGEVDGYILVPSARRHPQTIVELMAPMNLRERFNVREGGELTCELA
jgi:riboflavin kinase